MKKAAGPLSDVHILITRPINPASRTAKRLAVLGATPVIFPTIIIEPVVNIELVKEKLTSLQNVYAIIFVSPSAVEMTLKNNIKFPDSIKVFSPGPGTAEELNLYGIKNVITPLNSFDSEGLLELCELQSDFVNKQRIFIFRGNGGRELLIEKLKQRGALVEAITIYKRKIPSTAPTGLLELLMEKKITAISIMSGSAIRNLVALVPDQDQRKMLLSLPIYVSHVRIKNVAEALGFLNVIETEPGDKGLIAALLNYKK